MPHILNGNKSAAAWGEGIRTLNRLTRSPGLAVVSRIDLVGASRTRWLEGRAWKAWRDCFEDLADPRTGNALRSMILVEIMAIALCVCALRRAKCVGHGAVRTGEEEFRRQFLKLENGLPSHDTFSRVFRLLDPELFGACFQKFMGKFSAARHDAHGRQRADRDGISRSCG